MAAFSVSATRGAGATRVVSLELQLTETLVALGAPPIAAADNALYRRLVGRPELPASVEDLGPIQQPNLEFLTYLKPDLIVLPPWEIGGSRRALARVAPIEAIGDLSARPPIERLNETTRRLGVLVGRDGDAEALVANAAAEIDALRTGAATRPTFLCRLMENGRHVAIFGGRSVVGAVAERLGMPNAWTGRQSAFGTAVAAIEDLARVPDARLVHFHRGAETDRALARLARSPLWAALPMVRMGRTHAMPVVHPNGGLASAIRAAAQLATLPHDGPPRG
ncbi:ABC transporter substrate-binding protein [Methylopila sp. 73B]|uniref:ABC transporter substrate-binding protein n=1 Tax=Methylopila sp. 73B TaxID=1120792 RepID=UPI0003673F01|nr:ABC transporter substrate-binding protein [Methylopila sp. 73B]